MTKSDNDKSDPCKVKLHDGRVLIIDAHNVTIAESIEFGQANLRDKSVEYFEGLGKFVGLTGEEVGALSILDFRLLDRRIAEVIGGEPEGNL